MEGGDYVFTPCLHSSKDLALKGPCTINMSFMQADGIGPKGLFVIKMAIILHGSSLKKLRVTA